VIRPACSAARALRQRGSPGDSVRVLVVDDQAAARAGLRALLGAYRSIDVVGEASAAVDALQQVERLRRTLVLVDLHMPDIDVLRLTETLKALPGAPRIVLTTVDPSPGASRSHLATLNPKWCDAAPPGVRAPKLLVPWACTRMRYACTYNAFSASCCPVQSLLDCLQQI
jgi:CheY-like chemotaxis protein